MGVYIDDLTSGLISETRPPKPDESTAKLLTNGTDGFTAFPYRPQASFRQSLEKSSAASEDSLGTIGDGNAGYDAVFDFIVNGPYGIPADELLGPANADRRVNAVNRLHESRLLWTKK
jgi:hypothetical protein